MLVLMARKVDTRQRLKQVSQMLHSIILCIFYSSFYLALVDRCRPCQGEICLIPFRLWRKRCLPDEQSNPRVPSNVQVCNCVMYLAFIDKSNITTACAVCGKQVDASWCQLWSRPCQPLASRISQSRLGADGVVFLEAWPMLHACTHTTIWSECLSALHSRHWLL